MFGLDEPLEHFVNALKSAARGYGIEKRVLLLHGPVGSSKSTIARLLKKGLERYSASDDGALYTLGWLDPEDGQRALVPDERGAAASDSASRFRPEVCARAERRAATHDDYQRQDRRRTRPFCRFMYTERLETYDGDWTRSSRTSASSA